MAKQREIGIHLSQNLEFALDMINAQSVLELEAGSTGVGEQRVTVSSKGCQGS